MRDPADGDEGSEESNENLPSGFKNDLPPEPHDDLPVTRPDSEEGTDHQAGDSDREGPLGELAAKVERRSDDHDEGEYDDLFVSENVGDLDSDLVWEELETGGISIERDLETVEHVVATSTYCERCEYFSEPPEVACGHEGTDIVDMVDVGQFTVRNCPKVAEDIAVGEFDPEGE